jgi:hypothetical protein
MIVTEWWQATKLLLQHLFQREPKRLARKAWRVWNQFLHELSAPD